MSVEYPSQINSDERHATFVVVPGRFAGDFQASESEPRMPRKYKPKTCRRKARPPVVLGGHRSTAEQAMLLNDRALKDLHVVSSQLAGEMQRSRAAEETRVSLLQEEMRKLNHSLSKERRRAAASQEQILAQRHAHDEMTKAAQIKAEEAAGELARERAWRIKLQEESAIQMDQSKAMRARLEKVEGKLNQLAQAAATSEAAAKKFEHLSTAESRVASELSNRAHDLELKLTSKSAAWEELRDKLAEKEEVARQLGEKNSSLLNAILESEAKAQKWHRAAEVAESESVQLTAQLDKTQRKLGEERVASDTMREERAAAVKAADEARRDALAEHDKALRAATSTATAQDALREKAVEAARMQASLEVAQVDKAQAEKDLQEERRCRRDAEHAASVCRAELEAGRVEASSRASQAQRLEAQHKEMHDRLAHAQSALADAKSELSLYKERNAGLEKDVLREQGRNTALVEAKAKAEAKAESLSSAIKERDTIALTSSKIVAEREMEVENIRRSTSSAAEEAATWRERHMALNATLDLTTKELSSLRSRYSEDMAVKDKQIQDLVMWQDKVASERTAEQEQMNRHDVAMAGARSDLDKWHQIAQAAESERNQLRNDIAALQHQEQAEKSARKEQLDNAEAAVRALQLELGHIHSHQAAEMERKNGVVQNLIKAMEAEEAAKMSALEEARVLRAANTEANNTLLKLKSSLVDGNEQHRRMEDAEMNARNQLESARRKANLYRKENQALLSNYDRWLKQLVDNVGEDATKSRFQSPAVSARRSYDAAASSSSLLKSAGTYSSYPSAHSFGNRNEDHSWHRT